MGQKIRYFVDSQNRLSGWEVDSKGRIKGPRKVYPGEWKVEDGALAYRLREQGIPAQGRDIRFSGHWSLVQDHRLRFELDGHGEGQTGDVLTLTGAVLTAKENEIGFSVVVQEDPRRSSVRLLRLFGSWKADAQNRLVFVVEREEKRKNSLVFQGTWEIGKYHQIVYRYKTFDRVRRRRRVEQSFSLEGRWEISDRHHLTYRLGKSGDSSLQFRAAIQSPIILAKTGEIRYQLGIGADTKKPRILTLFGKWKLSRKLDAAFEMEYERGRREVLQFESDYHLNRDQTVTFTLKNDRGKDLGFAVTFTQDLLKKSGQAFLRLRRQDKEAAVEGGVSMPF